MAKFWVRVKSMLDKSYNVQNLDKIFLIIVGFFWVRQAQIQVKIGFEKHKYKKSCARNQNSDEKFMTIPNFFWVGKIRVIESHKILPTLIKCVEMGLHMSHST